MILRNVPVLAVALSLPLSLLVAWLFGSLAQWLLRGRARLGLATLIVVSVLGTAAGLALAGLIYPDAALWSALTVSLALAGTLVAVLTYSVIAAHFQHAERTSTAELLRSGESDQVEFKSTARVNLHTGAKDAQMEQVIAKTIAAFLNADGGTLLVGVDDSGTPLGLQRDFGTLKSPDADRFELWLRDWITTAMGQNAAAQVRVEFSELADAAGEPAQVCRITCLPSPRPVYLRPSKGASPEFWARSGNSTRHLNVDEAAEYISHRWPMGLGSSVAAQLRAAVRFSEIR